jgi:hypothetical protein
MSRKTRRNQEPNRISRREFLRNAGLLVGGAALGSTAFLSACSNVKNFLNPTSTSVTLTPANATGNITNIPKTLLPTNTKPTISPFLLSLSLSASNSAIKPVDSYSGYPIKDRMFIDWNAGNQTRWFQWNLAANKAVKILWQVSMMPFDNSTKTVLNPPGLVSSGVIASTQQEFSINTSKFTPLATLVKDNFSGPVFYTTAQQNISQSSISRVRTILPSARSVASFNSAIATQIANTSTQYARKKELLTGYSASLATLSTGLPAASDKAMVISDATMAATKAVFETTTFATMRTYYVRVVTLDGSDKPFGSPSNSIQILYGDPVFETDVSVLKKMVLAQVYPTGDFQYQAAIMLDWNGTASNLNKKYIAPLADPKNYAYSYFQVTQEQAEADKAYALYPDGLVATVLSQQVELNGSDTWATAKIDFSKFVAPPDPKNPILTRYYVRAVHVYSDYEHTGYAKLAFSPPMAVNYGDPKALAIPDSMIIKIDIGTPSIRFVSYTPPYFGDNPGNHAIVTKTPMITMTVATSTIVVGTPFSSLKPNDKVLISELQAWLEDQKRNEGADVLTGLVHAFQVLFTGIADLATSIGDAWTQIQAYAVSALASIGIPPVIGGLLINAAMMAAGIPPTLPNFDDLSNLGANGISDMIVQQSGGIVPKALADAAAQELMQQAKKAASTTISGLPDDLSLLNGCLKPDTAFVWKPATISIELYNPLKTQIPSGSFLVRLVEAGTLKVTPDTKDFFKPQTINYPPLKGGQKINLTIPLEEACEYVVGGGEKNFLADYGGGEDTTWNKLIIGHKQLQAVIENKQPNIPNPSDYMQELGTGGLLVHFNIIDSVLNIKQNMSNIKTAWNTPDNRFPSTIFVSPSGNDSSNGSLYNPVKTLEHALAIANANDSIVMDPGTYQATNLSITKSFVTLASSMPGVVIKTAANADFAFKVNQTATEFSMRNLEVDGAVYINGPNGVVLDSLKIINPKSVGIQMVNCAMASISNCEISKNGTAANIYNGIILDGCYAFVVSNCYIHDILGNGVQAIDNTTNQSALGIVKNSTIFNCNIGILMSGSGNRAENCFIHDTSLAGVDFKNSSNCSFSKCTLLNTASDQLYGYAPIYFDISPTYANNVFMENVQNYGSFPKTFYAENCIFSEGVNNNCIMLVNASDDHSQLGIVKEQAAYVKSNIYYSKNGLVRYIDLRTHQQYQFTNTGKLPPGITSFNWAGTSGVSFDTGSKELDPKLDSQGRSVVPDCLGMGIQ